MTIHKAGAKPGNLAVNAAGRIGKCLLEETMEEEGQIRGCPEPYLGGFTLWWRNNLKGQSCHACVGI